MGVVCNSEELRIFVGGEQRFWLHPSNAWEAINWRYGGGGDWFATVSAAMEVSTLVPMSQKIDKHNTLKGGGRRSRHFSRGLFVGF